MPVTLMSQWPHTFVGLSFSNFIWMKYLVFSTVKKKRCFVCFSATSEARHYSTPSAFDYFFLITSSFIVSLKIDHIFSGMEMCLMADQAVQDVPYI